MLSRHVRGTNDFYQIESLVLVSLCRAAIAIFSITINLIPRLRDLLALADRCTNNSKWKMKMNLHSGNNPGAGYKGEKRTTWIGNAINMIFMWNRLEDSEFDQRWSPCPYITQEEFSSSHLAPPSSQRDPERRSAMPMDSQRHSKSHDVVRHFNLKGDRLLFRLFVQSRLFFFPMHLNLDVPGPWPSCHLN